MKVGGSSQVGEPSVERRIGGKHSYKDLAMVRWRIFLYLIKRKSLSQLGITPVGLTQMVVKVLRCKLKSAKNILLTVDG
ncbi:hypothetical protein [Okeania hirsuta]|uniref:hypothetical protein n=1 Tax=Okeania hirsuta TaxID=1458930 RepID=UPI000F533709|nr:hypothetical protein [Okeania hirsuta]